MTDNKKRKNTLDDFFKNTKIRRTDSGSTSSLSPEHGYSPEDAAKCLLGGVKREPGDIPEQGEGGLTADELPDEPENLLSSTQPELNWFNYKDWTKDEVGIHLKNKGIDNGTIKILKNGGVDGKRLLSMTEKELEGLGIQSEIMRLAIIGLMNILTKNEENLDRREQLESFLNGCKVINDSIHGHITMPPLLVRIIDTPQFQRLRWIKQLGVGYLVYPGASHNRFEHSLGVAHLAGKFVRSLRRHQPELDITDEDELCVQIAGLCHDLGHGPYSHLFENRFIRRVKPESTWRHEEASVKMFQHMMDANGLMTEFATHNLTESDVIFIKDMIKVPKEEERRCRRDKPFLYEIVSNKRTGNDVDKWDYLARDSQYTGIHQSTFDPMRFMNFARVIDNQICCRDKEILSLYSMFYSRLFLHRFAYQHKTHQNLENMMSLLLEKANDHLKIRGANGDLKLSDCIDDMVAYCKLTDYIFVEILQSMDPKLKEAKQIAVNMVRRKLLIFIGETTPQTGEFMEQNKEDEVKKSIAENCAEICRETWQNDYPPTCEWWKNQLIVQPVRLDFGKGGKNPLENMKVYAKTNPYAVVSYNHRKEVSRMLPAYFGECRYRLYCRRNDDSDRITDVAKEAFKEWCKNTGLDQPQLVAHEYVTYTQSQQSSRVGSDRRSTLSSTPSTSQI